MRDLWGILVSVAWEQTFCVLALVALIKAVRRKSRLINVIPVSLACSAFLWPQVFSVYTHFRDPKNFPELFMSQGWYGVNWATGFVLDQLLVMFLFNLLSPMALVLAVPGRMLAGSSDPAERRFGYALYACVLPAWWALLVLQAPAYSAL